MDDLVAWLTQTLDMEESGWRGQVWQEREGVTKPLFHFGQPLTSLMLAHIATDRQILADWQQANGEHQSWCEEYDDFGAIEDYGRADKVRGALESLERIVRLLAQPYADREGFRDEWRVADTCPDCGLIDDHKGGCPQTGEAPQPGAPG